MKNIFDILKDFGLEIPEEQKSDFDKAWKENYRTKSEYDNAVAKRDEYKTSLDTVNDQLKAFEGVNVDDLRGQITQLQNDLSTQAQEFADKEAARQFNDMLTGAIKDAGGRNAKAVMAMMDIDALKASKDQTADIKSALESVKASDAYLFGSNEPFQNPVGATGGGDNGADDMAAVRAAMGLPAK